MSLPIDEQTRVLARFHPKANGRGLDIYNPYFQETGANVLYVLFPGDNGRALFDAVRTLQLPGAVVSGSFETDPETAGFVDDLHPISKKLGTIGFVAQRDGKLWGAYQGGFGLRDAIRQIVPDLSGRKITLLGAGNVARALMTLFELEGGGPDAVTVVNRDVAAAERMADEFSSVRTVRPFSEVGALDGDDLLVNATPVGSAWNKGDPYEFGAELVGRFEAVADVSFVPLATQLISVARSLGKPVAPGYSMFVYQAGFVIENALGLEFQPAVFERHVLTAFAE